ncbi:hypothetical protein [Synechococcus elongatus]|uniref:hypothetical protein n=1 Tax=Synechococcus elongatus TaxID=32046 RepID=UPI00126010E1|nr:hypothetical protein [Synechococcus elongatus]
MFIIAIAGDDGRGKSTLARNLAELISKEIDCCFIRPFAESLRREVKAFLPSHIDPWQKPTPEWLRDLLKGWGAMRRAEDPDYWIQSWRTATLGLGGVAIIDDLRYLNEMNFVQGRHGIVLFLDHGDKRRLGYELSLVRPHADQRFLVDPVAGHYASTEMAYRLIVEFQQRQEVKAFPLLGQSLPSVAERQPSDRSG